VRTGGNKRRGRRQHTRLWIAPVTSAFVAAAVAALALWLDVHVDWEDVGLPIFAASPDTARMMLSIIGGSVTTLLALIFTVIAVVIQLAIGQYTPRALSLLLGDMPSHFTIGVFVGTFTYSLIVLLFLPLTLSDDGTQASGLALTLAFVLAVVTIATFAVYSNHIIHSVRASSIIGRIASETRMSIERLYPPFDGEPHLEPATKIPDEPPTHVIRAREAGVLVEVDDEVVFGAACDTQCVIVFVPPVGAFVPEGAPLARIYGGFVAPTRIYSAVELAPERNLRMDVMFGLRQLTDIAGRALSSGINDPATAVQVIDQLNDLLRRLVQRPLTDGSRRDDRGEVRLILRIATWEEVLTVSLDELRLFGAGSLSVMRRLRAMIEDLLSVAPDFRIPSLERQLELLDQAVEASFDSETDRVLARQTDARGTGF
jgi:uncharacterized membrane protein